MENKREHPVRNVYNLRSRKKRVSLVADDDDEYSNNNNNEIGQTKKIATKFDIFDA